MHVDALVDLFEAAFDVAIPATHEQPIRDAVETGFTDADGAARQAWLDLVDDYGEIRRNALDAPDAAEEGLRAFRRRLDARLAAAPFDAVHRLLVEVLGRRQRTAWPGTPPVPASHADAWLETVELVVSIGRNEDYEPTAGQREALRDALAEALHGRTRETRTRLAQAHRTWLRLKATWDASPVERRLRLRWDALDLVSRAVPEDRRILLGEPGDLRLYAATARRVAACAPGYEVFTNLARSPEAVFDVLDAWLGPLLAPERDHLLLYR
jgi:hypothetical protein